MTHGGCRGLEHLGDSHPPSRLRRPHDQGVLAHQPRLPDDTSHLVTASLAISGDRPVLEVPLEQIKVGLDRGRLRIVVQLGSRRARQPLMEMQPSK